MNRLSIKTFYKTIRQKGMSEKKARNLTKMIYSEYGEFCWAPERAYENLVKSGVIKDFSKENGVYQLKECNYSL